MEEVAGLAVHQFFFYSQQHTESEESHENNKKKSKKSQQPRPIYKYTVSRNMLQLVARDHLTYNLIKSEVYQPT